MKTKSTFLVAAVAVLTLSNMQLANAQWQLGGNTVTKDTTLGTKNSFALRFITNNSLRMTLTSIGDFGVGTFTPAARLEVMRSSGVSNIARFTNAATTGDRSALVDIRNGNGFIWRYGVGGTGNGLGLTNGQFYIERSGTGALLTIANNGLVGIGTIAPSSKLDVAGINNWDVGSTEGDFRLGNPTYRMKIGVAIGGTGAGDVRIRAAGGTNRLMLGGGTSDVLTINGSGNVGIGTITPAAKLDISSSSSFPLARFNGPSSSMWMGLYENGTYRGYIGSFAGNNEDVDFGTGAGTPGKLHLTIQASPKLSIDNLGNVGIGTTTPTYKLDVCGTIRAKELRVETGWCDYVFEKDYKLPSLKEVEEFIKTNKHLPDVTPGPQIENDGLELGKVSAQMIKKIEELTLYVIELQKQVDALKSKQH